MCQGVVCVLERRVLLHLPVCMCVCVCVRAHLCARVRWDVVQQSGVCQSAVCQGAACQISVRQSARGARALCASAERPHGHACRKASRCTAGGQGLMLRHGAAPWGSKVLDATGLCKKMDATGPCKRTDATGLCHRAHRQALVSAAAKHLHLHRCRNVAQPYGSPGSWELECLPVCPVTHNAPACTPLKCLPSLRLCGLSCWEP